MIVQHVIPQINTSLRNDNKKISFSGNTPIGGIQRFFTLERKGNMGRNLFIANAFVFLLGGRVLKARDDNEKREIFTRDIPSIVIAVQGVPIISEMVTKLIQNHSGFAIGREYSKEEGYTLLREHRIETVRGEGQLRDWYVLSENLKTGLDGFLARLSDKNGNIKKVCSSLSEEINGKLTSFSESNDSFIKELNKSKNKELRTLVEKAFKVKNNKAFEKANFLKTIPRVVGFGLTLALLGVFIPKLNIHITEATNKKNKAEEKSVNA